LLADIAVGVRPRRFALAPDGGELWVSNELGASVSIIDPQRRRVVATLPFAPKGFRKEDISPVGLTFTRDGATAFVALGRANRVAVVDARERRALDYILVGSRPWHVALDRAEKRLFVTNGGSDDVTIIDVADRRVVKSVAVGRYPYAVAIDD
jgi:YVTN family beta-propeller protein